MKDKLKSRKLWVAIGGLVMVMATEWANISPEMAEKIIAAIVVIVPSYLAGQGLVDCVKEYVASTKTTRKK